VPWKFTYQGDVWVSSELTVGECEQIETATGRTWLNINPLRSAKDALDTLAPMVAARTGRPVADVRAELAALRADDLMASVEPTDMDTPTEYRDGNPQPADAPSTDGSSGAPAGSGGPPMSPAASRSAT
jgi:hypothetical protein